MSIKLWKDTPKKLSNSGRGHRQKDFSRSFFEPPDYATCSKSKYYEEFSAVAATNQPTFSAR